MHRYRGHVDSLDTSGVITGWAIDQEHPSTPANLVVLLDGAPIGNIHCSGLRSDLAAAGIGTATAGFFIKVPDGLRDGQERQISFRPVVGGDSFALDGLSKIVAVTPRGEVALDRDTFTLIGWVAGPQSVVRPVLVETLLEGVPLRVISCWADSPGQRIPFKVTLDQTIFTDPVVRMIDVRIAQTGELLAGSGIPTRVSNPLGSFDLLLGRRIAGWGFDVGHLIAPKLTVFCDDVPVMELVGTNFRRDLYNLYGTRSGGFDLMLPLDAFVAAQEVVSIRFPNGTELAGGPKRISSMDRDLARLEAVVCAMSPDQSGIAAIEVVAAQMSTITKIVSLTGDGAEKRLYRNRVVELCDELLAQMLFAAEPDQAFDAVRSLSLLAINTAQASDDFNRVVALLLTLDEGEADVYGLIELERQRRRPLRRLMMAAMLLARGSEEEGIDLVFETLKLAPLAQKNTLARLGTGLLVRAGYGSEAQSLLVTSMLG